MAIYGRYVPNDPKVIRAFTSVGPLMPDRSLLSIRNVPAEVRCLALQKISSSVPMDMDTYAMSSRSKREMSTWPFCASEMAMPS